MNKPTGPTAAGAGIKQVLAKLAGIQSLIEKERSTYSVSNFEVISGYAGMVEERLKTVESSIRTISQAGLTFSKGGKVNEALNSVASIMDKLAGNAQLGADAVVALSKGMEQFPMMAEANTKYAESLAAQAASLDRLGISFQQYTKNVDIAQNMFNMTKDQVRGLNEGLKDFADEMRMLPSVVSQNFQLVAKSLSYEGPKVLEQFKKMQTMSQQTGVSVGSLMTGFGDRLDTMSGAASFVGQLNAILGTNAFSPNEILMMDESERMIKIREVIRNHPIYDDIMSGDKLGKFALNTLSKVVGFSKEDTRKYLSGNMDKATADRIAGSSVRVKTRGDQEESAKTSVMTATGVSERLDAAFKAFSEAQIQAGIDNKQLFAKLIERTDLMKTVFLSREDAARAGERGRVLGFEGDFAREGAVSAADIFSRAEVSGDAEAQKQATQFMRDLTTKGAINFGVGGQEGLPDLMNRLYKLNAFKKLSNEEALPAFLRASFRYPQITRLLQTFQTLPNNAAGDFAKELGNLIELAGGAEQMQSAGDIKKFADSIRAAESPKMALAFRQADDQVTSFEARLLAAAKKTVGTESMGIYRFMLRKFREGEITTVDEFDTMMQKTKEGLAEDSKLATEFGKLDEIIRKDSFKANETPGSTTPSRRSATKDGRTLFPADDEVEGSDQGAGGLPDSQIPGNFNTLINKLIQSGGIKLLLQVDKNTAKEITATAIDL